MSFLQMSLAASVMILVILLIRTLAIHRLPKRFFLLLWVVVLLRLLVPFLFPLPPASTRCCRPNRSLLPTSNRSCPSRPFPLLPPHGKRLS